MPGLLRKDHKDATNGFPTKGRLHAEEVVLSSDGESADCILHTVVVYVVSAIKDIAA